MTDKWSICSYKTTTPLHHKPAGAYRSFSVTNNAANYHDPYYLVIVYEDVDTDELVEFLKGQPDNPVPVILTFSVSQKQKINDCFRRSLGKQLRLKRARSDSNIDIDWIKREIVTNSHLSISANLVSDINCYQLYSEGTSKMLIAKDIMIQPPITIFPDANLYLAWELMKDNGIGHLPVVERGKDSLIGLITQTDLYKFKPSPLLSLEARMEKDIIMGNTKVGDGAVLVQNPVCVFENSEASFILQEFTKLYPQRQLSLVPVLGDNNKKVKGVISYLEVFRNWQSFPDGKGKGQLQARELGSPIDTIQGFSEDTTIAFVFEWRSYNPTHHRHVIVYSNNSSGKIVGILDERALAPFIPIDGAITHEILQANHRTTLGMLLDDQRSRKSLLGDSTIAANLPLWTDNTGEESLVDIFVKSLEDIQNQKRYWMDRKTYLLAVDSAGDPLTLVTPADCLKGLLG